MRRIIAFVAGLVVLSALGGGLSFLNSEHAALATDPTPAPGACPAPTSTPPPTPTPMFPLTYLYACNDTRVPATGLRVLVTNAASLSPLVDNAPGCPTPRYEFNPPTPTPLYSTVDILWDTPCVDPGETVVLGFSSDCPGCEATLGGHSWLFGTPTPTSSPAPTPSPNPTPTPPPTATPGALPKTGGARGPDGAPYAASALLIAMAAAGGATWVAARRRA